MERKKIVPPMSEREIRGAEIARRAASQGMVLLKNENGLLPIRETGKIGLFGNGAVRTVRGGTGSGDPFNGGLSGGGDQDVDLSPRYHIHIMTAFEEAGFEVVNRKQQCAWAEKYDQAKREVKDGVMSVFAFPEEELDAAAVQEYAGQTDLAICVVTRNSGEGNDRFMKKEMTVDGKNYEIGDYRLSGIEIENLRLLRDAFAKLVLVLNVPGPIAVEDLDRAEADAILLMGQAGQEGGAAVLDVLTGKVTPSGKLTATWARSYEDYPAAEGFLKEYDRAPYTEGIYVGYRYFDTFRVEPGYAFGYGLSYTTFALEGYTAALEKNAQKKEAGEEDVLQLQTTVTNTGTMAGREVVQVYVSAPASGMDMPLQELKGFCKTKLLQPGESEQLSIQIPVRRLASYSQKDGGYILSEGDYGIRVGTSSRETCPVCRIRLEEKMVVERVRAELPLKEVLEEKKGLTESRMEEFENTPVFIIKQLPEMVDYNPSYQDGAVVTYTTDPEYQPVMPYERVQYVEKRQWTLEDAAAGKVSLENFVAQLDAAQLAELCCGTGWGVQDENNPVIGASSESVPGAAGETTHNLEYCGVPSIVLADGPGGVRVTQQFEATDLETGKKRTVYHYCTAWPVGTLLAQSFDEQVLEEVGQGMAADMQAMRIALLLGPGMNIQRDPMCGRNFEYFSEDPLLTGKMAAAMVRGIQSLPGGGGCIKHYAANNQETNRNAVNSVIGQRALREIYLEPFRIAIGEGRPLSIMTSYNLINGVPTADSYDLCTDLARTEWGFDGLIMTDWNGGSSTPWISMHAGNDLIMPGGRVRSMNILQAVRAVLPDFDDRGEVVMAQEIPFAPVLTPRWNSFTVAPDGPDTVTAPLGEGHQAEIKQGRILVDGEEIYLQANDVHTFFRDPDHFIQKTVPVDESVASLTEDGRGICYRGILDRKPRLCLGDVQKCAVNVLRVILKCMA